MKRILNAGLTALALGACAGAWAIDDGPYIGASIGQSSFKDDFQNVNFDEDDTGWKVFGGARWGMLGIEGGYVDFGNPAVAGGNIESDASGFDLFGMLILPLGPVDLFGKVGGIWWETESRVGDVRTDDDGVDLAWGLGLGLRLGSFQIRAEYERFEIGDLDELSMISIGGAFIF
jgi:hypothetical protein